MLKYDANQEIMHIYENWQIIWTQFFTHKVIFIYIRSNWNIYLCIGIWIRYQQTQKELFAYI
jgi:hypothetical protein